MNSYYFILVLTGVTTNTEGLEDAIFEAGCDDALIFCKNNAVYLEFDREADSFETAVISAINDVEASNLPIVVTRVEVNTIVNMSDIAQKTNLSRQIISMYASGKRGDGSFPAPIAKITSSNPLWNWAEVAHWMAERQKLPMELAEQAEFIEAINDALVARSTKISKRRKDMLQRLRSIA